MKRLICWLVGHRWGNWDHLEIQRAGAHARQSCDPICERCGFHRRPLGTPGHSKTLPYYFWAAYDGVRMWRIWCVFSHRRVAEFTDGQNQGQRVFCIRCKRTLG